MTAEAGHTDNGTPEFTLTPDQDFLDDPSTVYPVVVDPAFTTYTTGDTWVQNKDFTSSQSSSQELRVGTNDGGVHKARSYMEFATSDWNGKRIVDAELVLRNFQSSSCSEATIRATRITESWTAPSINWSALPAVTGAGAAEFYAAQGYDSGCPTGDARFNVSEIVQAWASGTPNNGIRLSAGDETDSASWRKYRSAEYSDGQGTTQPKIVVTYNSYPSTPSDVDVTDEVVSGGTTYIRSTTPLLSALVSDPDPGSSAAQFELSSGGTVRLGFGTGTGTFVGDNQRSYFKVPPGVLEHGQTYQLRIRAADGSVVSPLAGTRSLQIDTTKPTPVAVSSTDYPDDGSWHGNAQQFGEFVFAPTSPTVNAVRVWFGDASPVTLSTSGEPVHAQLSPPSTGRQVLHVQAVDRSGASSDPVDYSFLVGQLQGTASAAFVDQIIQEQFARDVMNVDVDDEPVAPAPTLPGTINETIPPDYVDEEDPAVPDSEKDEFATDTLAMPVNAAGMLEMTSSVGQRRAAVDLPRGESGSTGTLGDSQTVIYPNSSPDTDTIIRRTGADELETYHLLRSAMSERSFGYMFALGAGEQLRVNSDDDVAIIEDAGGSTILTVEAPLARDASGATVPVELTQSESTLLLTLSPNPGQSLRYPILVDPVFRGSSYGVTGAEERFCAQPSHWRDCIRARSDANNALNEAEDWVGRYATQTLHYGIGDAFRHCYWSARMEIHIGHDDAYQVATRHESESRFNDKEMDLTNNKTGRWAASVTDDRNYDENDALDAVSSWCKTWAVQGDLIMVGAWKCPYPPKGYTDRSPLYPSHSLQTCIGPA